MNIKLSMNYLAEKFKIKLLRPFGLEISTREPLQFTSMIDGSILKELVKVHRIVVLRGFAAVEKTALVEFAKSMGPLLEWEFGNVMEMRVQEEPKNYLFTHGAVPFHWDGAFHTEPRYLLFNCIEAPLPDCGGETIFVDTSRIWTEASDAEKSEWRQRKLTYKTEKLAHYGGSISVPLVRQHIDTGENVLRFAEPVPEHMLNPVQVTVNDIEINAGDELIRSLAARCYQEEYCYVHSWQQQDFLIADNNALIHGRRAFRQFSPRHLRRIQVL